MKPYEKNQHDTSREERDLKTNPIMRWLQNQGAFRFNVDDILIKKTRNYNYNPHSRERSVEWNTEVITKASGAPKKYVYAFENKLGIGYVRQLKADGSGYCGTLICVASFDPENTRFELDPDFVDHTLIGDGNFNYNNEYLAKKKFRQEAKEANKKLLIKTTSKELLADWFLKLKVGDVFWYGHTFDTLATNKYKVSAILKGLRPNKGGYWYGAVKEKSKTETMDDYLGDDRWQTVELEVIENCNHYRQSGFKETLSIGSFYHAKVSETQPHPMKDQLCGPPR